MIKCLYCGKDFKPKKPKQVYCSDHCRAYANRGIDPTAPKRKVGRPKKDAKLFIENAEEIMEKRNKVIVHKDVIYPLEEKDCVQIKTPMPKGLTASEQIQWKLDHLILK